MKAPCKDCPDRHTLCHMTCEKYLAYDKYRREAREKNIKEQRILNDWNQTFHYNKR